MMSQKQMVGGCLAKWKDFSRNLIAEAKHCAFHFAAKLVNACAALSK
jgi:hypothetical protein